MRPAIGAVILALSLPGWAGDLAWARVVPLAEGLGEARPGFEVLSSAAGGVTLRFNLDSLEIEDFDIDGRTFSLVSIPGGTVHGDIGRPAIPAFTRLVSIPARAGVRLRVLDVDRERIEGIDLMPMQPDPEEDAEGFEIDGAYYASEPMEERAVVTVGEPAILRDLRVVPLTVRPVRYAPAEHVVDVARSVTVEVEFVGEDLRNAKETDRELIPSSFDRIYRALVANYEGPRAGQRVGNGSYLVICPDDTAAVNRLQPLLQWRTRMGYPCALVTFADIGGSTADEIRDFIQNAYDTWDIPPEYVVLVGDPTYTSSLILPTFHEPFYGVEGDHPYTLLEGGDLLSDVHLGRISVGASERLGYVVNKILSYETDPYIEDPHWFTSACLIGDPTYSGITCVHMMQWIKQRLLELGYTSIDEWYQYYAAAFFTASVNSGVGIMAYRGIYGLSGIDNSDIGALANGEMMPFAVILTCGTGSFEEETSNSEKFFRSGTIGVPQGAVGCIGTAGTNTHTRYNNVMMMGIMDALLYQNIPELGACLTSGKLAMYLNFFENEPQYAEVYAYWNNLIGDPATRCWTQVPADPPSVAFPDPVPVGTGSFPATVTGAGAVPLEGACVCLWRDGEVLASRYTDENGEVEIPVQLSSEGPVDLTVSRWNSRPFLGSVTVAAMSDNVALAGSSVDDDLSGSSSGNADGTANPGETIEFGVELQNLGTNTAHNVSAVLSSTDPFVAVVDGSGLYGDILPGEPKWSADELVLTVSATCPHGHAIPLAVDVTSEEGSWRALLDLPVTSVKFDYEGHTCYGVGEDLDPGESAQLSVAVGNSGGMDGTGVTARLVSLSQYLAVTDPEGTYGAIPQGGSSENSADPFGVAASTLTFPGHLAPCLVILDDASGAEDTVTVGITIGTASSTDPVGPDAYGYYAFDNTDAGYADAPAYAWIEIAGNYGGPGTDVGLNDQGFEQDQHGVVDLPFDFVYYGQTFDQITVCSNGWIAMGDQDLNDCWNMTIPHPGGPNGMIAPFWDDLYQPGGAEVWTYDDGENHRFIVEWSRLRSQNTGTTQVFEVILTDPEYVTTPTGDGPILFQYNTVFNGDCAEWQCQPYATVGIESPDHTDGLLYSFWNNYPGGAAPLAAGLAVKFVPVPPQEMGFLAGHVTNLTAPGVPVERAEIRMVETGRALFTGVDGTFFGAVGVDTCTVIVSHPSFTSDTTFAVAITKDDTTTLNFALYDIAGPDITGTTRHPMTGDAVGPYAIHTHIHDCSGLAEKAFYYRRNFGPFEPLTLSDLGDDDYLAEIPGVPLNTRVDYYLYARDISGLETFDPPGAPGDTTYVFHVLPIDVVLEDDFEEAGAWTVASTAVTGLWERVDPNATYSDFGYMVQPEDDHTPSPGTQCYITGQSPVGALQGMNDVDAGYTRLDSPVLDLSGYGNATLSYYRWYTNDTGSAPNEDFWRVQVTANGTDWEDLESTTESRREWTYREFYLEEHIALTSQVQIRFTAEDAGSGSIVEAGVDDLTLVAFSVPVDTEPPTVTVVWPNGGEFIAAGGPFNVRWRASDDRGISSTRILFSTDGGATYPDTLAKGAYDSTFVWNVPEIEASNCRIRVICLDGASNRGFDSSDADFQIGVPTAVAEGSLRVPPQVVLEQNRPNPFNPTTEIVFGLPAESEVAVRIFSVEGRLVKTLVEGFYPAGYHSVLWAGEDSRGGEVSSGIYFCRLEAPGTVLTRKMLMLK